MLANIELILNDNMSLPNDFFGVKTSKATVSAFSNASVASTVNFSSALSETELSQQIDRGLSAELWRMYKEFLFKRRAEILTLGELQTLQKISTDVEWLSNHRLCLAVELAEMQRKSVEEVMSLFIFKSQGVLEKMLDTEVRNIVLNKSKGLCEYCHSRSEFSFTSFTIEMIIPKSEGGKVETSNLAYICQGCGNYKYSRSKQINSLFNPRTDIWREHFAWSGDKLHLVGLTSKGRTTIEKLDLNRVNLTDFRLIMTRIGKHPAIF